jgi:hypothetical protein
MIRVESVNDKTHTGFGDVFIHGVSIERDEGISNLLIDMDLEVGTNLKKEFEFYLTPAILKFNQVKGWKINHDTPFKQANTITLNPLVVKESEVTRFEDSVLFFEFHLICGGIIEVYAEECQLIYLDEYEICDQISLSTSQRSKLLMKLKQKIVNLKS